MVTTVVAGIRTFLVRGLAVLAVVLSYALGNVGVLSVAGISALGVTTTAMAATARRLRYYRKGRYGYSRYYGYGYRRW